MMSGFCYITDGRESYFDIAAKFFRLTDFLTREEFAEAVMNFNSHIRYMGSIINKNIKYCSPCPYQLIFIPMYNDQRAHMKDIERTEQVQNDYPWTLFKQIKDKQEKGLNILEYTFSSIASEYHNYKTKQSAKEEEASAVEKFEKVFKPIEHVNSGLNSKKVLFAESCDEISASINKTHLKLAELNKAIKKVRQLKQQINIFKNEKASSDILKTTRVNKDFYKSEVGRLKDEVVQLAKETEELSKNEISKASRALIKLKVDISDTALAEKIYGEGKAIVIECFEHPKFLRALSTFSKGLEKASPWIVVLVGGYEVYEAYEEGKDWKEEAVARGVQVGFTIAVGGLIIGALTTVGLSLLAVVGLSILAGIIIGAIGEVLYSLTKWAYEECKWLLSNPEGYDETYKYYEKQDFYYKTIVAGT